MRIVLDPSELCPVPPVHWVKLTTKDPSTDEIDSTSIPIILPHDWLGSLHEAGPDVFRHILLGEPGSLEEHWAAEREDAV